MPFFECAHEIFRIFIADHLADLVDCQRGTLQEQVRFLKADLLEQLRESTAKEFLDISGTIGDGIVQMSGKLFQGDGGIILLQVQQDLVITVTEGNGLCGCRPVFGQTQQQDHQHAGQDAVRVAVRGEHLAEHIKNILPDLRILSGAEEQVLLTVFIVNAAQQKTAQQILSLEKYRTDFRESRQAYQDPDGVAFGTGALGMSGRRRQDTEISRKKSMGTPVDLMDAAARQDIDDLEISMRMLRDLHESRLEQDHRPLDIGGDIVDVVDDVQDMVPGDQRDTVRIMVHRHSGEQRKEIAKIRVGGG